MTEEIKAGIIKAMKSPSKRFSPRFYLFQSKYPKRKHFSTGFLKLCKDLMINADIRLSCTREAYNDSDNTAWVLLFGARKEGLNKTKEQLSDIEYKGQKVFNVSGNGYGTGLSVMLNYNKFYK